MSRARSYESLYHREDIVRTEKAAGLLNFLYRGLNLATLLILWDISGVGSYFSGLSFQLNSPLITHTFSCIQNIARDFVQDAGF